MFARNIDIREPTSTSRTAFYYTFRGELFNELIYAIKEKFPKPHCKCLLVLISNQHNCHTKQLLQLNKPLAFEVIEIETGEHDNVFAITP